MSDSIRDYLYSFIFRSEPKPAAARPARDDLQYYVTLKTFEEFLGRLDTPQSRFPIIHVAGTNGKGSTCALINAALSSVGLRVGMVTSPHLSDLRERIRLGSELIPERDFQHVVDGLRPIADEIYTGERRCFRAFGQMMLAIGLRWFVQREVDIAIVETGYGGTYDNSNVLQSAVSVITPISLDHKALLGGDLLSIAAHKAGIIKHQTPLIVGPQQADVQELIDRVARTQQAPVVHVEAPTPEQIHYEGLGGSSFSPKGLGHPIQIPLAGRHQMSNAVTALRACEAFCSSAESDVGAAELAAGLNGVHWPGRFELRRLDGQRVEGALDPREPLIVLDGAHNPEAVERLAETIKLTRADREVWLLLAAGSAKKTATTMFAPLLRLATRIYTTRFFSKSSHDPRELAQGLEHPRVESFPSPTVALGALKPQLGSGQLLLVTGSLFLVGEVSDALAHRF